MGSNAEADWQAFAQAAKARPHMLFIVSAGNDGRDLDKVPVYPAGLGLENILTVTSAEADGRLARGSNWGAQRVDVMVPGEQVAVTDHRGAAGKASGSSFAVPRVTALAARLSAKHPDWRGPELKAAIVKRARKPFGGGAPLLRHGWIPDPTDDFEG
jgi:subtilisin family serine protease